MARNTYGNTTWDEAVDASNPAQLALSAPGGTYPLFNAAGVAQTDFKLWNASTSAFDITATSITVGSDRYLPLFQGPDATELYDAAGHRLPHLDNLSGVGALTKADVGLDQVDNTSDANKPVSTATAAALAGKQDAIPSYLTLTAAQADAAAGLLADGAILAIKDPTS